MLLRALLVLAMLWPAAAAGQTRSGDPAAALVEQLEQAAAAGSIDAITALGVTLESSGIRMFTALAVPKPTRGSGDFTSLIGTDGFVELPVGPATLAAGTPVALYSW